ncbi:uncharacterized protein Tco025E_09461, partial [Trypanosoma conorhini]
HWVSLRRPAMARGTQMLLRGSGGKGGARRPAESSRPAGPALKRRPWAAGDPSAGTRSRCSGERARNECLAWPAAWACCGTYFPRAGAHRRVGGTALVRWACAVRRRREGGRVVVEELTPGRERATARLLPWRCGIAL